MLNVFKIKKMYTFDNQNNRIHKTAVIYDGVKLGSNNHIGPFCTIYPNAVMGSNNNFVSYCSIASPPEHKSALEKEVWLKVIIGNNCRFNEFVTVNCGTVNDTVIGNGVFMLRGSHVGHDCIIGNNVTLSCNALIGGHSIIENDVNFGLGSICHQFSYIGRGAMIGMGTIITKRKRIAPFKTYVGNPVNELKDNQYLIDKLNIDDKILNDLRTSYQKEFLKKFHAR